MATGTLSYQEYKLIIAIKDDMYGVSLELVSQKYIDSLIVFNYIDVVNIQYNYNVSQSD